MTDKPPKLAYLARWDAIDAMNLAQHMVIRMKMAHQEGKLVGFVAVLITEDPTEEGRLYESCYSQQAPEISLWAARKLELDIMKEQGLLP